MTVLNIETGERASKKGWTSDASPHNSRVMPPVKRSFKDSAFMTVMKETNQHESLRRGLIHKIESAYKSKIVTFFTSFRKRNAMITDSDAEMMESILASEPPSGRLILILNSPGGQALAAERIVNVCRSYAGGDFEVLVPHMAKSAATMICFGASKIHVSKTAELGPVDPQVPYWGDGVEQTEDNANWISAEEYVRSYDKLVESASDGTAKRLEPFIQQLSRYDARFIEQLRSIQKLSSDICVRLLKSSMMKGKSEASIRKSIDPFLTQKKKSSHGRMINYEEAEECGLRLQLIDLHSELWHTMWELYVRSNWSVNCRCEKLMETSTTAVQA